MGGCCASAKPQIVKANDVLAVNKQVPQEKQKQSSTQQNLPSSLSRNDPNQHQQDKIETKKNEDVKTDVKIVSEVPKAVVSMINESQQQQNNTLQDPQKHQDEEEKREDEVDEGQVHLQFPEHSGQAIPRGSARTDDKQHQLQDHLAQDNSSKSNNNNLKRPPMASKLQLTGAEESIDKVEDIILSKQRNNDGGNMKIRSSVHKENQQQTTSNILGRSDIFIFSNQAVPRSINKNQSKSSSIYSYLNEKEMKIYLQDNVKIVQKSANDSSFRDLDSLSQPFPQFSTFQDWSKLIDKLAAAQTAKVVDKDLKQKVNPFQDIFKAIIGLRERAWYDELAALYKEKNGANKSNMNMQETIFYKKMTQIQDHFRWFISSVANLVFNTQTVVSSLFEFPPSNALSLGKRKTSSLNSASGAKHSQSEKSDYQQDLQMQKQTSSQIPPVSLPAASSIINNKVSSENNSLTADLPNAQSSLWQKGFIWRGVFFRLISQKKAKHLKGEIRALKHIAIEYLQNDFSYLIASPPNNSSNKPTFVNYMLPLLCYVENSSFVLYGTPVIQTKQNSPEEGIIRQSGVNIYTHFSSCFLLKNLKESNLSLFHKSQETQGINNSTSTSLQSSTNIYYIIQNGKDLLSQNSENNCLFAINQNSQQSVQFFQVPTEGFIEIQQIKKMLNYEDIDFKYGQLNFNHSKIEKQSEQQQSNSQFSKSCIHKLDLVTFKKHGWSFKMIFMSQYDSKNFSINKKASDLLSIATDKSKDIKNVYGNVLVFSHMPNTSSLIIPSILHDEESYQRINSLNQEQNKQTKTFCALDINQQKEEYLSKIWKEQINQVVAELDQNDWVLHSKSLTELCHQKGVNMRMSSIILSMLNTQKQKVLVSCDILARVFKRLISEQTSSLLKQYSKQQAQSQDSQEKNDLFALSLFKAQFCRYFGLILKGDLVNEDILGYLEISQGINLFRMKVFSQAQLILSSQQFQLFSGTIFIKDIIRVAFNNINIFLQTCSHHFGFSLSTETERNIRNDKYHFSIRNVSLKPVDLIYLQFKSIPFLSIKEMAGLFLIKLSQSNIERHVEIKLPSSLYKISDNPHNTLLRTSYFMPTGETLKDLVSYLSCIFGNLYCVHQEHNFFLELYIFQLFDSLFIDLEFHHFCFSIFAGKDEDDLIRNIMNEKIQPFLQNAYAISAELSIVVYTWFGILQESKSLLECEQSYLMALLGIHKLYGDPRGRGSSVTPWELFVAWRLSLISRLQGKKHDAEYVEELYDSVQFGLQKNVFNSYKFENTLYQDPFTTFEGREAKQLTDQQSDQLNNTKLPFSHWTEYQQLDENSPIMEVLTTTIRKNTSLLPWMMSNLLFFQEAGTIWETTSLRAFQLGIMQKTFQANSSCSSISSLSDKYEQNTPKSQIMDSKQRNFSVFNQSGNIVQVIEKDCSTFSKKDAVGIMFSWGQNTQGQIGGVFYDAKLADKSKKIKINFPRLIIPLKDTIITSVACGYQHSMAITYTGNVLAWGDNSHSQLGLGEKSPQFTAYPHPINNLNNISLVSCGSEHSIALDNNGSVFSWGNGEGGLLGHGNEDTQYEPKEIDSLRGLGIEFIVCGGLHSLVLTKNRQVYSWGRNEGGQLGLERKYFTNERCFVMSPQRVRGSLEGIGVIQVAAGEAHSLALALNGQVYGWGYNMNGQLGIGEQQESYPVYEPLLIPKLSKIEKVYSGQTFSMFMNQQKELICCGLNDSNQLGLEKEPIKINTNGNNNTNTNALDQYRASENKRPVTDVFIPKKMDCFHQLPVLHVSCGHNHSLALVVQDTKHYMLFAWGMHKHGQLGIGETGQASSIPRPITYLQDVTTYSMACGSYHSLVVANDINRIMKKDSIRQMKDNLDKFDIKWDAYCPSDEGKIDNPKDSQRRNSSSKAGVKNY